MSSKKIIVNKLLAFLVHTIDSMDDVTIREICRSYFEEDEISSARLLLFQSLGKLDEMPIHRRDGTWKHVQDMIDLLKETNPDNVPYFVANKQRWQPHVVRYDHVDITRLLNDMTTLKAEMTKMQSRNEVLEKSNAELRAEIALISNVGSGSESPQASKVNRHRGVENTSFCDFESTNTSASSPAESVDQKPPAAAVACDSTQDAETSHDSLNLLACSSDGTVACIQFTNKEIGTPLTIEEKNAFYEKIYGKCLANESGGDLSANLLVECPEILLAREKEDAKKQAAKEETTPKSEKSQSAILLSGSAGSSNTSTPLRPMDRQIETRTSDGKRRITPVFIPLTQVHANESLGSQPGGTENCFSTSSQSKSRIKVEVRDDIIIHPNVSNHATSTQQNNSRTSENGLDQRLRKRGASSLPGPRADELSAKRPCGTTPATPLPAGALQYVAALPAPALGTAGPVVRAAGQLRLQVVNKACNTQYGTLSRLQLLPNNSASSDPVWETYLGSAVTCIACDVRWACVACADGTLHAWRLARHTARRALPPIALMSQAAKLTLSGDTLGVVSTSAELAMWELSSATCVIRPLCFRALLSQGVTVTNCSLLDDGNPMISLSNGKSYIYSKGLCAWVVWADACDPVWRCSGAATNTRVPKAPLYPLARMNRNRPNSFASSSYSAGAARSWLEAQVASCLHLRLAKDYRHWLTQLFTHLVNHGTEDQLRTILDDMLGPSHCTSTPKKWQPSILGIKKHELLEEMLSLLIRELRWQRMYAEYNDQLTEMKSQGTVLNGH